MHFEVTLQIGWMASLLWKNDLPSLILRLSVAKTAETGCETGQLDLEEGPSVVY